MYIGETERNIRQLFATAKRNERCLIFFDELDSIAPRRDGGAGGGGGGVMHRVVSQLLAELDAVNLPTTTAAVPADSSIQQSMVFVVGATNRPDLIAPELLMPGRFERLVYLDVASSREEQLKLLQAVCRKIPVAVNGTGGNNINSTTKDDLLRELVEHIPLARWTGADFYAMCTDALTKSVGRTVALVDTQVRLLNERLQGIDNNCGAADDELLRKARKYLDVSGRKNITADVYLSQFASDDSQFQLTVGREDFLEAIRRLQPSVSPAELDRYRHLQKQFR
jgi:peroxin-6